MIDYLATGGTSHIYKCRRGSSGTILVIKIMRYALRSEPDAKRRMHKEIFVHKQLSHAHIIPYYDDGRFEGLPYVILAYAPLGSLYDFTETFPHAMTLGQVAEFVTQLADALHYLHEREIIHRDVKPSNILLKNEHNVMLTDFGIVRTNDINLRYSFQPGTLNYMAPEQLDSLDADYTSDQFGLAVVTYWLLTGEKAFLAEDRAEAKTQRLIGARPVHEIDLRLPRELSAVMKRAMHHNMKQRYTFIEEFAYSLSKIINENDLAGKLTYPAREHPEPVQEIIADTPDDPPMRLPGEKRSPDTTTYSRRPNTNQSLISVRFVAILLIIVLVGGLTVIFIQPNPNDIIARDPMMVLEDLRANSTPAREFPCRSFIIYYNEIAVQVYRNNPDFSNYALLTSETAATRTIAEDVCLSENAGATISVDFDLWQSMRAEIRSFYD
ncbi:MAG: serine/threonine-protein kinase [Chloroflexota bacterium]